MVVLDLERTDLHVFAAEILALLLDLGNKSYASDNANLKAEMDLVFQGCQLATGPKDWILPPSGRKHELMGSLSNILRLQALRTCTAQCKLFHHVGFKKFKIHHDSTRMISYTTASMGGCDHGQAAQINTRSVELTPITTDQVLPVKPCGYVLIGIFGCVEELAFIAGHLQPGNIHGSKIHHPVSQFGPNRKVISFVEQDQCETVDRRHTTTNSTGDRDVQVQILVRPIIRQHGNLQAVVLSGGNTLIDVALSIETSKYVLLNSDRGVLKGDKVSLSSCCESTRRLLECRDVLRGGMPLGCINFFGSSASTHSHDKVQELHRQYVQKIQRLERELTCVNDKLQVVEAERIKCKSFEEQQAANIIQAHQRGNTGAAEEEQGTRAEFEPFNDEKDDDDVIRCFWNYVDPEKKGRVTAQELQSAVAKLAGQEHNDLLGVLEEVMTKIHCREKKGTQGAAAQEESIDLDVIRETLHKVPRIRGQRVKWAKSIRLEYMLARHLKVGGLCDGLSGIRAMSEKEIVHACDLFSQDVQLFVKKAWVKVREEHEMEADPSAPSCDARSMMSKYVDAGGFLGRFGDDLMFQGGLESEIGLPDALLMKGILHEHISCVDSDSPFLTSNYEVLTTPLLEYALLLGDPAEYPRNKYYEISEYLPMYLKTNSSKGPSQIELRDLEFDFQQLVKCFQAFEGAPFPSSFQQSNKGAQFPGCSGYVQTLVEVTVHTQNDVGVKVLIEQNLNKRTHEIASKLHQQGLSSSHQDLKCCMLYRVAIPVELNSTSISMTMCVPPALVAYLAHQNVFKIVLEEVLQTYDDSISVEVHNPTTHQYGTEEELVHNQDMSPVITAMHPAKRIQHPARRTLRLLSLMNILDVINAELRIEEAIQAYQYTGPMFHKWNGLLRKMPLKNFEGNRYATSIHVLISAVLKLSRKMKIPSGRKVFRGMGGRVLDDKWFVPNERGCRGGVELAFLSTTLDRRVALQYSGVSDNRGIIFEIEVGAVDCGAQMNSLSQYPAEGELLFGPLSHLEVVNEPFLEHYGQAQVVVIQLKINVNLKALTIEEMLRKRQQMAVSVMDNLSKEIRFELQLLPIKFIGDEHLEILSALDKSSPKEKDPVWFNLDKNLLQELQRILSIKQETFDSVLKNWRKSNPAIGYESERDTLHVAAQRGKLELVNSLLLIQADVNGRDHASRIPLHYAVSKGYIEVAKALIDAKSNLLAQDQQHMTCLILASLNGHPELVKMLIAAGSDVSVLIRIGHMECRNALHMAAHSGQASVVEALIQAGSDLNAVAGNDGSTPLHYASGKGHIAVVKLLLQAKANVNARDLCPDYDHYRMSGKTPIHCALDGGHTEVVNTLFEVCDAYYNGEREMPIHSEIKIGDVDHVKRLIHAGSNVNTMNAERQNPLHLAAQVGDPDVVLALVAAGADVNAIEDHITPLHLASKYGHEDVVRVLIQAGSNCNFVDSDSKTPLHLAAEYGHLKVVSVLIAAGSTVNMEEIRQLEVRGWMTTALDLASSNGHDQIVRLLIDAGAKPSVRLIPTNVSFKDEEPRPWCQPSITNEDEIPDPNRLSCSGAARGTPPVSLRLPPKSIYKTFTNIFPNFDELSSDSRVGRSEVSWREVPNSVSAGVAYSKFYIYPETIEASEGTEAGSILLMIQQFLTRYSEEVTAPVLKRITVIDSPLLRARFEESLCSFEATQHDGWDDHPLLNILRAAVPETEYSEAKPALLWHCTSDTSEKMICSAGFDLHQVGAATSNPGWFGRGLYFTTVPAYATWYNHLRTAHDKAGDSCIMLNWVLIGRPRLMTQIDIGRPQEEGYTTHYAVTNKTQPVSNIAAEMDGDEIVVFDENHVLPQFLVELE